MFRTRKIPILALLLALLGISALLVYRWIARPPRIARLLPEGNLVLFVDLRTAHFFDAGKTSSVQPESGYEDFARQTGIQIERDLDSLAISQRNPGGNPDSESSAIFLGRFDTPRLEAYLKKISTSSETYADKTIFSIPHEGNLVRVCIAGERMVVVTNMPAADPMRGILDRVRNPALIADGPFLLEHYYVRVPAISPAWLIYRAPGSGRSAQLPGGLHFDFLENKVTVASVRFSGSVLLKAEVLAENEDEAKKLADSATVFLAMYNSAGQSAGTRGLDPDVKAVVESIRVQQSGNSAVFTAAIPAGFFRKAFSAAGDEPQPVKK